MTTDVISSQPIACPSDQQADHVTHRTTSASKYSSQGLSQQLSNKQVRRAIKGNTLINGGNIQQTEFNTKDSCKIALATGYRVYRPVPATQPCTLVSTTGYRVYRPVPATQPCTLASTTVTVTECTDWYWLHSLVHLLQQLVTECTDWYWLHSLVHWLQPAGYKV